MQQQLEPGLVVLSNQLESQSKGSGDDDVAYTRNHRHMGLCVLDLN